PDARVAALAGRAEAGDVRALEALREAGNWLGVGVASAANLLNPRGVVVGGYFATLAHWLVPGLEEELAARVLSAEWDAPGVVTSELGAEAAVRGASGLALRRVFADPGLVAEL
ncbi:MAG: ROK family protein, partial [Solirubrobacteraceae bacterium]